MIKKTKLTNHKELTSQRKSIKTTKLVKVQTNKVVLLNASITICDSQQNRGHSNSHFEHKNPKIKAKSNKQRKGQNRKNTTIK